MKRADILRFSTASLGRQKLRTFLTTAGVVIGVGALVLMVSLGIGVKIQFLRLFETDFMIKTLTVSQSIKGDASPIGPFGFPKSVALLRENDIRTIAAVDGVASVSPNLSLILNMHVDGKTITLPVLGIPQAETAHELREAIIAGEFWRSTDERSAILPSASLTPDMGSPESLIGKQMRLESFNAASSTPIVLTVRGVYDSDKLGLSGNTLWLPLAAAEEIREESRGGNVPIMWDATKKGYVNAFVKVRDIADADPVKNRLRNAGYHVMASTDAVKSINLLFLIVEGFLACIGGIGLVIALLGIANTMAMAVLERTREIGIMKALGCADGDIRRMFLMESAMVGAIGGAVGIAGGWLAGVILDAVAHAVVDLPEKIRLFHVSFWLVAGTLTFAILVSALAGFFPARRAANLDPVKALKHE